MLKNMFKFIAIIGIIIIFLLSFIIPSNPYIILPTVFSIGFDKPLWLGIVVFFGFFYLMILWNVYEKLERKSN